MPNEGVIGRRAHSAFLNLRENIKVFSKCKKSSFLRTRSFKALKFLFWKYILNISENVDIQAKCIKDEETAKILIKLIIPIFFSNENNMMPTVIFCKKNFILIEEWDRSFFHRALQLLMLRRVDVKMRMWRMLHRIFISPFKQIREKKWKIIWIITVQFFSFEIWDY